MKKYLIISALALSAVLVMTSGKPEKELRQVVYRTTIDCDDCVKKVTENVSFEKGVKDLKAELSDQTVTIVYTPEKTDTAKLANSIRKLGYVVSVIEDKSL